ncbi:MAG: hypothetical protein AB7V58_03400 [Solirubrobacterales bacterium]
MTNALHPRARTSVILAAIAAMVALLAFAPRASAARDPIAGGTTDLHMKKGFLRKLGFDGITVTGIRGGTVTGNKISLPVASGMLDPTDVQGHIEPRGGFKLSLGRRGVPIYGLSVNTVRGAVYATIAKAHMQLGTFATPKAAREGFGSNFKAPQLFLSEQAVRRISNRLGLRGHERLNPNRVLSNVYSSAQPETVTVLPQGTALLVPNKATMTKFAVKGVKAPGGILPIAPATMPAPNAFSFPISGGSISLEGGKGSVGTEGGVEIVKKSAPISPTVKLKAIIVDFTTKAATVELEILPNPPFPGATGRSSIADVSLPAGTVIANAATRQVEIKNGELKLQAVAASTLNNVFNQPAPEPPPSSNFVVGDPLGLFSAILQAQ